MASVDNPLRCSARNRWLCAVGSDTRGTRASSPRCRHSAFPSLWHSRVHVPTFRVRAVLGSVLVSITCPTRLAHDPVLLRTLEREPMVLHVYGATALRCV